MMKLKPYKKKKLGSFLALLLFIIILSVIASFFVISYFGKKANKVLLPIAIADTRKIITLIINSSVTKQIANNMNTDNLFKIEKNNNDEIQIIDYNSKEVTTILNQITYNIQYSLRQIESGNIEAFNDMLKDYDNNLLKEGIIAEIPFGVIFDNPILNNIFPKVKLKLNLIGDVISNLETEIKPYGINNALIEVRIHLEVSSQINLPFVSERVAIANSIPISMKIIEGSIPEAYISSFNK